MAEDQVLTTPRLDPQTTATQASEQTGSQPSEDSVIEFKPTARYQDPDDPNSVIDGSLLKTRINRGKLADQFQSQRDKAVQELVREREQATALRQQLETLQKQVAAKEQEEATLATIRRMGIKPESQGTGDSESSWFTEQPEQPQLTQQQILQELGNLKQDLRGDMSEELQALVQRFNEQNLQDQQSKQRVQSFVTRARQADEAQLRADMPDLPDQDITRIMNFHEASRALEMKAQEAILAGDESTAEEAFLQAQANAAEARNLQARAIIRQQELAAEKELQEQTEMFAPGGSAFKELEEAKPTKFLTNKAESKKAQEEHLERAKQFEANRKRIFSR